MVDEKAASVKLLLLDVDGVLTDGSITVNDRGVETKSFNVKDGVGLKMLMAEGIEVIIVSGRESSAVEHRARDLGIGEAYLGVSDKKALTRELMDSKGLDRTQVCAMGDDLPDMGMFMETGVRITVADGAKEIREVADFITKSRGGQGAVREACEWILKSQGRWRPGK